MWLKSYNIDLDNIHVNCVCFFFILPIHFFISLFWNISFKSYIYLFINVVINHYYWYFLYLSLLFSSSTNNTFPWAFLCFFQRFLVCLCAYFLFYFSFSLVICACTGSSPSSSYKVTHSKNNICIINISTQAAILVESAFGKKKK